MRMGARTSCKEERTIVMQSTWINAQDLLCQRNALRLEVAHLRAENERLRGALVEEVLAEMHEGAEDSRAQPRTSSTGC